MKPWIIIVERNQGLSPDYYGPFESSADAVKFYSNAIPDRDNLGEKIQKTIWELKDPDEILSYPITLEIENV